ncbi:heme exporter protein CcmD [Reinekea thalattae]|uniref:Heme exporter protein D n=1 Tax=Reinekea thalattae TaxID=2593301 RepID=A0A5C8Z8X6_9GAMM|nr:heme exporter protein CcmD [Reinekea thalattae]TXR53729.1 heme exporter protein CcmD [Reinekea thalattae]
MPFNNLSEFIFMDGHGVYVWLAYGISALVIVMNLLALRLSKKKLVQQYQRQLRRERG